MFYEIHFVSYKYLFFWSGFVYLFLSEIVGQFSIKREDEIGFFSKLMLTLRLRMIGIPIIWVLLKSK